MLTEGQPATSLAANKTSSNIQTALPSPSTFGENDAVAPVEAWAKALATDH